MNQNQLLAHLKARREVAIENVKRYHAKRAPVSEKFWDGYLQSICDIIDWIDAEPKPEKVYSKTVLPLWEHDRRTK